LSDFTNKEEAKRKKKSPPKALDITLSSSATEVAQQKPVLEVCLTPGHGSLNLH
jgi:hypothetical protein